MIIGARNLADLQDFKHLNPNLQTLGLVPGEEFAPPDHDAAAEFARSGADIIRLWPPWIFTDRDQSTGGEASQLVERMHQLGKPVWTTVDVLSRHQPRAAPRGPCRLRIEQDIIRAVVTMDQDGTGTGAVPWPRPSAGRPPECCGASLRRPAEPLVPGQRLSGPGHASLP